jgi:hypothetical protein
MPLPASLPLDPSGPVPAGSFNPVLTPTSRSSVAQAASSAARPTTATALALFPLGTPTYTRGVADVVNRGPCGIRERQARGAEYSRPAHSDLAGTLRRVELAQAGCSEAALCTPLERSLPDLSPRRRECR